jgi:membrane protein DedA with SNARE-associated domain
VVWFLSASALVAALTTLGFGLAAGRTRPAWLRFVAWARTGAAMVGGALIIVGLIHYRDTEPRSETHWIVLGLAVLVGAGLVHWWVIRTERRVL